MGRISNRQAGIIIFILIYPIIQIFLNHIPNPILPGAIVALNMILPVLCGFLFGPMSGFVSGAAGAGISALVFGSLYISASVLGIAIMGYVAGILGKKRWELLASLSIFAGHILNMVFFFRIGLVKFNPDQIQFILLGIISESTIDIVAITLLGFLLKRKFYEVTRW